MPIEQAGYLRAVPTPGQSIGALVTQDGERFTGGKLAKTTQVTAAGDTTILTPTTGKAIALYWVSAINDPDQSVSPRIRIGFAGAADYLYSGYAVAHWESFVGAVNQSLVANLDQAGDVAIAMHFSEV